MTNRKGLRPVPFTTHEFTERTQDPAELVQLFAVLDITEDTFNEWRQLMRDMRQICPGAEELTFDELSILAQRRAEDYERSLISNDHECEDAELVDLTDTAQAPTVLPLPVDQIRGVLPSVQHIVPSYLYFAAIAALFCGLVLVVQNNRSFQHVDNNVRKGTSTPTPTPPLAREIREPVVAGMEPSPQTRPERRTNRPVIIQGAPDSTSKTPVPAMQPFVQEASATPTPTDVRAQSVSPYEPQQKSNSNERIDHFTRGLGSRTDQYVDTTLFTPGVIPRASPSPSATPGKSGERGHQLSGE